MKRWYSDTEPVYSYWWCTNIEEYEISRKGHTVCHVPTAWRARQIIQLLKKEYGDD